MLIIAAALANSSPCSPAAVASAAVVSPMQQQDLAAIGLSNVARGFQRPSAQQVAWSGSCAPLITGLYGGTTLVTSTGLMLWTRGGSALEIRGDHMLPTDPEPAHPNWQGHRFMGSASLAAGDWRVGAWARSDAEVEIARYRPGNGTSPIVMMTSAKPILGLFYLGAPDSIGGTLFFAQRLGQSRFRMIAMPWSEAGLRTPNP